MKLVRWTRFTWDLTKLPDAKLPLGQHYAIRPATREEATAAQNTMVSAFTLDSTWNDILKDMRGGFESRLSALFEAKEPTVLVLTHGVRVIGASAYDSEPAAENHLVSGPCISMEYRNRGLGAALLMETLRTLRDIGLSQAHGVTKQNVSTAKFLYPKFGSISAPFDFEPQPVGT